MNFKFLVLALLFIGALACSAFVRGGSENIPVSAVAERINAPNSLLLISNFDSGSLTSWDRETCCVHSVQTVEQPKRASKQAVKFELRKNDPNIQSSKRTELVQKTVPANSERWYGFSLMLPSNWKAEASFEIIAQWHSVPDFALKENWRTPPLYLSIRNKNWRITNRWDPKPRTLGNDPRPEGGKANLWEGPYQKDVWTDWVIHVKWSAQSDGLLQIWKDGTLVVNKTGPNTYNDKRGPFFKIGIYKPDWRYRPKKSSVETRVLYADEVRIGDGSASYAAVVPPGNKREQSMSVK